VLLNIVYNRKRTSYRTF